MPFESKAQQRKMFSLQGQGALKPGTAKRWADETLDIKDLPEKVGGAEGPKKAAFGMLKQRYGGKK